MSVNNQMIKICLTIGVSKTERLDLLPGALTAADEVYNWAQRSGYITEKITDENEPVTIARIKSVLESLLCANEYIEHLVLHFAGHGYRTGAEQHVWLPSNWYNSMQVISVEASKASFISTISIIFPFSAMPVAHSPMLYNRKILRQHRSWDGAPPCHYYQS
jgi:hypothetical protein